MSAKYDYVSEFKGYVTKPDPTNTSEKFLTAGSFNVLVNDTEKVTGRKGYTLFGASSSDRKKIESEFVWNTSSGVELMLRALDNKLQVWSHGAWRSVITGLPTSQLGFCRSSRSGYWVDAAGQDYLLFVAKDSNIYSWSGAIAEVASTTSNTITKTGTETWAEARANLTGTKIVIINGTEYTYTGGESTTTLTGVTPDPTGEANGSIAIQKVTANANQPGSGLTNDIIDILNNQVYVGDFSSREVYVSKNNNFLDYTFSVPREPGEGMLLTLDNTPNGFVVQEDKMYISAGTSDWYETALTLQGGTTITEDLSIKKLKNAPQQAAKEKDLIANIKNSVVFISNEPTLEELGRVENVNTPQSKPLSDPIKPDFDSLDFTGGDVVYWKNQIFIAVPVHALVLIYDINNAWWQPPQTMAISKFSVFEGKLIGHSSLLSESYELFADQYNDLGNVINYQAVFAYRNFGDRTLLKNFDEFYTEGYISGNTNITLTLQYDFSGGSGEKEYIISGTDTTITTGNSTTGHLGSLPLGRGPLGSSLSENTDLKKFRQINGMRELNFHELRSIYSTSDINARFEILAHGPQVRLAPIQNNSITK
jgi:hypothetical protein